MGPWAGLRAFWKFGEEKVSVSIRFLKARRNRFRQGWRISIVPIREV